MLKFRRMHGHCQKDIDDLFDLYRATPEYFLTVKGRRPEVRDAVDALTSVPPGRGCTKVFGGYFLANELIGCSDLVFGYPDRFVAYIGLLLFREDMQSNGYGSWAHRTLCEAAVSKGYRRMRLSIIDTNAKAKQFWIVQGYREIATQHTEHYTGDILVLEREL